MARLKLSLFREQPRAFSMIFMLEIWERFGFYTMQGILTLYFIRHLGFDEDLAYYTFGAFSALVYGMVALGGYLGDRVLGTKRTLVLGLVVLATGYLSLSLVNRYAIFFALALVCVGNGLFKANPSSLLSKAYEENDPRLHAAFTLYYMAINLGSTFALIAGPSLATRYGYSYAYLLSFIGILVGLANYFFQRHHLAEIPSPADERKITAWQWLLVLGGILLASFLASYLLQHVELAKTLVWFITFAVVLYYFYSLWQEKGPVAARMILAFILMVEGVAFFTLYQQMPTSLNLFAVHNVNTELLGFTIDPQSFQALNPLWIIILSPILAIIYARLNKKAYVFPVPYKFALGMTCCGLSFVLLYFSRYFHDPQGIVSSWWLVLSYMFQSLGELLVSALGVAMVAELVPQRMTGFVMGMWFLTSSVSGFIGASVASYTALPSRLAPGLDSLLLSTEVFAYIGFTSLAIALFLWLISPRLCRLMKT
jgi:POT family proton-dependent oligopeptide transporter